MPKALLFHSLGGPEVLRFEDISPRKPASDEVWIAVEAVGLNRAESMYYHGAYFEQPALPPASVTRRSAGSWKSAVRVTLR